jgi:hypothetical protein
MLKIEYDRNDQQDGPRKIGDHLELCSKIGGKQVDYRGDDNKYTRQLYKITIRFTVDAYIVYIEEIKKEDDIINVVDQPIIILQYIAKYKVIFVVPFNYIPKQLGKKGIHEQNGKVFKNTVKISGVSP